MKAQFCAITIKSLELDTNYICKLHVRCGMMQRRELVPTTKQALFSFLFLFIYLLKQNRNVVRNQKIYVNRVRRILIVEVFDKWRRRETHPVA